VGEQDPASTDRHSALTGLLILLGIVGLAWYAWGPSIAAVVGLVFALGVFLGAWFATAGLRR
jgi:hypothetical protein